MNVLENIISAKIEEVKKKKKDIPIASLEAMEYFKRNTVSLSAALKYKNGIGIIAEIKRKSPSAGILRKEVDIKNMAASYQQNGAAAISVLTEENYFNGSLNDLKDARSVVDIPILRKDFIIDEYEIYEAKAFGADAVLLIADLLSKEQLRQLFYAAKSLGLECLVEIHSTESVDKLDFSLMKLIGINNRDLNTFSCNLDTFGKIAKLLPEDVVLVSESGIKNVDDLLRLQNDGAKGALIGEYFMKSENPGSALSEFISSI
ncbi:MAG: indole-3-glycerol phosphate synthase TrpC [Bacteroidota bacterium]|nr:indole-3-glycerol phosphate synthase TrpC [Bacteroidota bacterium]